MWQKKLKKTVFTLNVDNYAPEITELTYPLIKRYADKIGADFYTIKERKFPGFPPVYEKLQIYELAQKMENDWNIYIDSDALIHPDLMDITNHLSKDTVSHYGSDLASNRWKYDRFFSRDGRNIGSCGWFTIASDWCVELWKPLDDLTLEEAVANINPILNDLNNLIIPERLIDDYTLSRNIAKYGLKFTTFIDLLNKLGQSKGDYFWHQSMMPTEEKVKNMRTVLANWRVSDYKDPKIEGWMSYSEMIWLYLTAQKMNSIVEVGAWKGRSAHALASGCPGTVYLVDDFKANPKEYPDAEQELRTNMAQFKNVQIIEKRSVEAAKQFKDKSIDMVFLDGSHDRKSVSEDIEAWYPKCKTLLCGHDFNQDSVKLGISDTKFAPESEVQRIWSIDKTCPCENRGGAERFR